MLILSRRVGEAIIVGGDIKITALSIKGNQVWLGISAPLEVSVYRQEIYERIQNEQKGEEDKYTE